MRHGAKRIRMLANLQLRPAYLHPYISGGFDADGAFAFPGCGVSLASCGIHDGTSSPSSPPALVIAFTIFTVGCSHDGIAAGLSKYLKYLRRTHPRYFL